MAPLVVFDDGDGTVTLGAPPDNEPIVVTEVLVEQRDGDDITVVIKYALVECDCPCDDGGGCDPDCLSPCLDCRAS